ncbi:hypothetical protein RR46_08711 [Papilio xuthus]|uniref:Uncharacterized protein n=1 Tax=Papilio xuthus TaxID=66420 RepID=A0A194Q8F2_PAPXU|nr:hypothetical protein RR46_08711 [Papilio xuthus]
MHNCGRHDKISLCCEAWRVWRVRGEVDGSMRKPLSADTLTTAPNPPHAALRTPHAALRTPHAARRTSHAARRTPRK